MTPTLTIAVLGEPRPQGSKNGFVVPGKRGTPAGQPCRCGCRAVVSDKSSTKLKHWRQTVKNQTFNAIAATGWQTLTGPVAVDITFYFDRPQFHLGTGRNAGTVKASAPAYPAVVPDIDKLARASLDSLTDAAAFTDDSRVIDLIVRKRYAAPGAPAGVHIAVRPVLDDQPNLFDQTEQELCALRLG